eukprot:scaffold9851_cov100-Isochrysis_galbana.AAC.1
MLQEPVHVVDQVGLLLRPKVLRLGNLGHGKALGWDGKDGRLGLRCLLGERCDGGRRGFRRLEHLWSRRAWLGEVGGGACVSRFVEGDLADTEEPQGGHRQQQQREREDVVGLDERDGHAVCGRAELGRYNAVHLGRVRVCQRVVDAQRARGSRRPLR